MDLRLGQILLQRYRLDQLLGEGGFGAVYYAWDLNLDVPVAVKESLDPSPAAEKQFRTEAQLLFTLRHPNLPRVHDCFTIPEQGHYLVMDYIAGTNLNDLLHENGGPLPVDLVLPWMAQICDALDYLHRQTPPIIHRDIKPANIIISTEASPIRHTTTCRGCPYLVDFGISKIYDPDRRTTLVARSLTPGYAPPEQYGVAATDARSDIYSLGATLYHLLSGKMPPLATDMMAGVALPPVALASLVPSVPQTVSQAVMRALEPSRSQRWSNIQEFRRALLEPAASQPAAFSPALPPVQAGVGSPKEVTLPGTLGSAKDATLQGTDLRETLVTPHKPKISVAHPRLLAKRYSALFLVQIYPAALRPKVARELKRQLKDQAPIEHIQDTRLEPGTIVEVKLHSLDLTFTGPVVRKLSGEVDTFVFNARPNDGCLPGQHPVILSVTDQASGVELDGLCFPVQVTDYVFGRISRPMLSQALSLVVGAGSLATFILTLLGQVDTTFGLTSGTVGFALASGVYLRFVSLFEHTRVIQTP